MVLLGVETKSQGRQWKPSTKVIKDLHERYLAGESIRSLATLFGVDYPHVYYQLDKAGVTFRKATGHPRKISCRTCKGEFIGRSSNAQFCSKECQYGVAACEWCGKTFIKRPPNTATQAKGVRENVFCSRPCEARGRRVPDDRRITSDGYVSIRLPEDWPYQGQRYDGTMLEHRYVMTVALGRRLRSDETVHHINGDRADNRLENLQLRQGKHGRGVKMTCQDCGSHNVEPAKI